MPSYTVKNIAEFSQGRKSDTIFVFGAGPSLRTMAPEEWQKVDQHNTIGWRLFAFQEYAHADYMILRESVGYADESIKKFLPFQEQLNNIRHIFGNIATNPKFQNVQVIVQGGFKAVTGNRLFGYRIADPKLTYYRYKNGRRDRDANPAETFEEGISHVFGTLTDAVNLAYLGGWKHIVLIGVDLNDMTYFLVPDNEENPLWVTERPKDTPNSTAESGIVEVIGRWHAWLAERGVKISVYNPKSLLAGVIPVFCWEDFE